MRILLLFLALALGACDTFTEQDGRFTAYNQSPHYIGISIEDRQTAAITAWQRETFRAKVSIPRDGGIVAVDQTVPVGITVTDFDLGRSFGPVFCYAGAKVTTNIVYEITEWGIELSCPW